MRMRFEQNLTIFERKVVGAQKKKKNQTTEAYDRRTNPKLRVMSAEHYIVAILKS